MKKTVLRTALRETAPVMTGYLFLGFGFGILMYQNGYGLLPAAAMSIFIYAGSMQYVGVSLLASGAGLLTTALTTLLVNARHLFYGIAMIKPYRGAGKRKPYLIFALTDETFSLASRDFTPEGISPHGYRLLISAMDQVYWVSGTVLGSLAGSVIPFSLKGIDFALTALFVTIFTEQWLSTKDHAPAVIGVSATALCLIIFESDVFLVPSMLLITASLALMPKIRRKTDV